MIKKLNAGKSENQKSVITSVYVKRRNTLYNSTKPIIALDQFFFKT